jgi:hypothetical protein
MLAFDLLSTDQQTNRPLITFGFLLESKFYGQALGLISTGQLNALLRLHFQPINLVVYKESHWQN